MSESITNLSDAVAAVGALPVPVGPEPQALSMDPRIELIRRERTHCEAAQFESEDDRLPHVWGPSQYPGMEMCQRCTVRRDWAEDAEAADTVLLAEVDRLRSQVAALLAERHETNEALDDAVHELRAREGRSADRLTRMLAPSQALREEQYESLHHDYRVGRDLPEAGAR